MTKASQIECVRERIATAERSLADFKDKVYKMRRIVAGDIAAFGGGQGSGQEDQGETFIRDIRNFPSILITGSISGRSNQILQALRTLLYQTAFTNPDIEFDDIEDIEEILNSQWCKIRMGEPPRGSNTRHHMRLALLDAMISGIGWQQVGTERGIPATRNVDCLDMVWDQSARFPQDIKWAGVYQAKPWKEWKEIYGNAFQIKKPKQDEYGERIIELVTYYDCEGTEGNKLVFAVEGSGDTSDTPIYSGPNPFYYSFIDDLGKEYDREYYLPFDSVHTLLIPSVRNPMGIVEQMLPAQIALHQAEDTIKRVLRRLPAMDEIEEGAYDDSQVAALKAAQTGELITRKANRAPLVRHPGGEIPQTLMAWKASNEQQMTGQSGASPFASGKTVQDLKYATEATLVQENANLMASTISKENAGHWERVTRKLLGVGALFDDVEIRIRIDNQTLDFGPMDPISQYLRPDATVIVKEGTADYRSQAEKVRDASNDLQVAVSVAQMFPQAPMLAYEKYLKAVGEKNPSKWLEAPQQMQMNPADVAAQAGTPG